MPRTGPRGRPARSDGLLAAALLAGFVTASVAGAPGGGLAPARAQAAATVGGIEIVLDASGSMRGRMGGSDRMSVAKEFVAALREALAEDDAPPLGLRAYGSASHRLRRDCTDTRLLAAVGTESEALDRALADLEPLGVSPLAHALERAVADTATTYVLITDGADNCGGDACETWRRAVGRAGDNRRLRLHVVAIEPEPADQPRLRCVSRAGSGTCIQIDAPEQAGPAARRLTLILRNRGRIDVRLSIGEGEAFSAPVRLLRPLTGEVVTAFPGRRPRPVPAGVYDMAIETAPPISERVMVLPGETLVVERSDFGRLVVELEDGGRRAPVSIRPAGERVELRYVRTGDETIVGAGTYDVEVDLGDSLVVREGLDVATGSTTRVVVGGGDPGTLRVVAPGFEEPPRVPVLAFRPDGVDTLAVGRAGEVPPGRYRLVVQSLPPYVTENVVVDAGRETVVALPGTGVLGVEIQGPEGPLRGVRVDVQEPQTGESYGALSSGERTLAMPGTFRLRIRSAPPIEVEDVVVRAGEERVVERRLSRIAVAPGAPAGTPPLRLEVLSDPDGRRLAEAAGPRPSVAARPGTYLVRLWRGAALVWEGRISVAPEKTARIDWAGPQ